MGLLDVRSRLDPEMAAAVKTESRIAADTIAKHGFSDANPEDLTVQRTLYNANRAYWNTGAPEMASTEDLKLSGPRGPIPARLHKPSNADALPVLVYLHGGGWIVGNLDTHDRIMRLLAEKSGWAVLGVEYRLAPETKFPGPQEDCIAAADWATSAGARHGLDPDRIAFAGDSAGANMAMAVLLSMKAAGTLSSAKAALLYYGSYGLRDSGSRRLWGGPEDGLSAKDLAFFRECLFRDPVEMEDPRFDILANDLSGLPPLFALAVEMDPLHDDTTALAAAVAETGGTVEATTVPGVLHGFLHMSHSVRLAMDALDAGADFLKKHGG